MHIFRLMAISVRSSYR